MRKIPARIGENDKISKSAVGRIQETMDARETIRETIIAVNNNSSTGRILEIALPDRLIGSILMCGLNSFNIRNSQIATLQTIYYGRIVYLIYGRYEDQKKQDK